MLSGLRTRRGLPEDADLISEAAGLIPGLAQWPCSACCKLWLRPGTAALIQPLAWELPCATGMAVKKINKNSWWATLGLQGKVC